MSRNGVDPIPEMIVVAVVNKGGGYKDSASRVRDSCPPIQSDTSRDFDGSLLKDSYPMAGGADNYIRYIKDEIIPAIDAKYRTTSFRVLLGHSLMGLLQLQLWIQQLDLFGASLDLCAVQIECAV